MADKKRLAGYAGFFLVALFLAVLFLLPKILKKNQYQLPTPSVGETLKVFPLDKKLKRLVVDGQKRVRANGEVSLQDLFDSQHPYLIVNFWATWCPPCIQEMPSLEFLARQLKAKSGAGPLVIAISVDDKVEDIQSMLATFDFVPSFTILHDPSGALAAAIGTSKFPETYWVNRDGQVGYKWSGPQEWLSRDVLSRISDLSPSSAAP